jgi:hypothetical protein
MHLRPIPICAALLALAAAAAAETTYQDPPGRFTLVVPDGWTAAPQDTGGMGGVQLRRDATWMLIGPFGGASDRRDAVSQLTEQFRAQYRTLAPVKSGDFKVGGQPAVYATFDAVNSRGARIVLTLAGVDSPSAGVFVVISAAPQREAATAQPVLDRIRETVRWYEPGAAPATGKQ